MDKKDLMIVDWIMNDLNEIQRVEEIREECIMLAYNDFYTEDELEPIPITPEILEKNGFKRIQNINKLANPPYFYRLTITENYEDNTYNTWLLEVDNRGGDYQIDGDFEYDEILQGEVMNYKARKAMVQGWIG